MPKNFKIPADKIRNLAEGHGGCIATDMITVAGQPVGFMYREAPDDEKDSGWRFISGSESEEYMNTPDKHGVYDVNTIANYDAAIIPFLSAPVGSAFERGAGDEFVQVELDIPED